jgi:hypothetical protein
MSVFRLTLNAVCIEYLPDFLHDDLFVKKPPRAAINSRFSFAVLIATRIIRVVRPGNVEQSRMSSPSEASPSVTTPAEVQAGSSISTKFAADG